MNGRKAETGLAYFTLGLLALYAPLETLASSESGLWANPNYWIDVIAMALLLWGAVHSLRARPAAAPGLLCGAYGWTVANGWRATFARVVEAQQGASTPGGVGGLGPVAAATAVALACFALSLYLVARAAPTVGNAKPPA